jgi:hypothetical protein
MLINKDKYRLQNVRAGEHGCVVNPRELIPWLIGKVLFRGLNV